MTVRHALPADIPAIGALIGAHGRRGEVLYPPATGIQNTLADWRAAGTGRPGSNPRGRQEITTAEFATR